jgi:hypothetical protein
MTRETLEYAGDAGLLTNISQHPDRVQCYAVPARERELYHVNLMSRTAALL